MSNIINLPVITSLPVDPKRVLDAACEVEFERVIVIGRTADGDEYFASSDPDGGTLLSDMERCRHKLMRIADDA